MFWFLILVLYVCFICSLANNQMANRQESKRQADSNYMNYKANKTPVQCVLPPLLIKKEEIKLTCPQKENNIGKENNWLFELGF